MTNNNNGDPVYNLLSKLEWDQLTDLYNGTDDEDLRRTISMRQAVIQESNHLGQVYDKLREEEEEDND